MTKSQKIIRDALVRSFKNVTLPQIRAAGFDPSPMIGQVEGLNDGYYCFYFIRLEGPELQMLSFVASGSDRCISAQLNIFHIDEGPAVFKDLKDVSAIPLVMPPLSLTSEWLDDYLPIPFLWIRRNRAIADDVSAGALTNNADDHAHYWASRIETLDRYIEKWRERQVMMTIRIADLKADAVRLLGERFR